MSRQSIPADPSVKNFSYTVVDNEVYYRENSFMKPVEVSDLSLIHIYLECPLYKSGYYPPDVRNIGENGIFQRKCTGAFHGYQMCIRDRHRAVHRECNGKFHRRHN